MGPALQRGVPVLKCQEVEGRFESWTAHQSLRASSGEKPRFGRYLGFGKGECAMHCAMPAVTTWHDLAQRGTTWHNSSKDGNAVFAQKTLHDSLAPIADRPVKIGFTVDLKQRMAQMKTDHPGFKLLVSLPGTLHTERLLHDAFALTATKESGFGRRRHSVSLFGSALRRVLRSSRGRT